MNKQRQIDAESETLLNETGGESLAGSGFENEIPEPDFVEPDSLSEGEER